MHGSAAPRAQTEVSDELDPMFWTRSYATCMCTQTDGPNDQLLRSITLSACIEPRTGAGNQRLATTGLSKTGSNWRNQLSEVPAAASSNSH